VFREIHHIKYWPSKHGKWYIHQHQSAQQTRHIVNRQASQACTSYCNGSLWEVSKRKLARLNWWGAHQCLQRFGSYAWKHVTRSSCGYFQENGNQGHLERSRGWNNQIGLKCNLTGSGRDSGDLNGRGGKGRSFQPRQGTNVRIDEHQQRLRGALYR